MDIFFDIVIGSVGLAYFVYGKKQVRFLYMLFGLFLMFYSYFISNVVINLVVGIALAAAPVVLTKLS